MAYDIGAEIVNLKLQQWHSRDNAVPESSWRLVHRSGLAFDHEGCIIET